MTALLELAVVILEDEGGGRLLSLSGWWDRALQVREFAGVGAFPIDLEDDLLATLNSTLSLCLSRRHRDLPGLESFEERIDVVN